MSENYPALLTSLPILTFVIGYLLGERTERNRIRSLSDEVRETMALLRARLDRDEKGSAGDGL